MRLIDADEMDVNDLPFTQGQCRTVRDWLALRNTVDAEPVVYANWKPMEEVDGVVIGYQCTHCGALWTFTDGSTPKENNAKFCPECGARMDVRRHG